MTRILLMPTIGLAGLVVLGGCNWQPYVTDERLDRGLVVVLSGIEGRGVLNDTICLGLDEGGVDLAIENYQWAIPMALWTNLRSEERNWKAARKLSEHIMVYRAQHPGKPVYIIGQSGGGAIAVWATQCLPPDVRIEGVVLLAPALSPDYPLDDALYRSEKGVVSFYSENDWLMLGVGTRLAGTMDGQLTESAGMVGFVRPDGMPRALAYEKLYQVPWQPEMIRKGHAGGHLSTSAKNFVSSYVAPLVGPIEWNERTIEHVLDLGDGTDPQLSSRRKSMNEK
jgi:hypothetical protein